MFPVSSYSRDFIPGNVFSRLSIRSLMFAPVPSTTPLPAVKGRRGDGILTLSGMRTPLLAGRFGSGLVGFNGFFKRGETGLDPDGRTHGVRDRFLGFQAVSGNIG